MASKEYWIDLAEYDLATAKAMMDTKRYLYVGFMCHQCIEKALKGYCVFNGLRNPPYTHNLMMLADKSGLIDELDGDQMDFFDVIQPLNIEARYPETKQKLLEVLNEERCMEIYTKTEEFFKWIIKKL
jgi:HEPN domain-containing protein